VHRVSVSTPGSLGLLTSLRLPPGPPSVLTESDLLHYAGGRGTLNTMRWISAEVFLLLLLLLLGQLEAKETRDDGSWGSTNSPRACANDAYDKFDTNTVNVDKYLQCYKDADLAAAVADLEQMYINAGLSAPYGGIASCSDVQQDNIDDYYDCGLTDKEETFVDCVAESSG
jgi:hypothetical protein